MKKQRVLAGISSLLLIFGLVLVGCPSDSGGDGGTVAVGGSIDPSIQGRWYTKDANPVLRFSITASQVSETVAGITSTYSALTRKDDELNVLLVTVPPSNTERWTYTLAGGELNVTKANGARSGPLVREGN